jgi:hypothetical protein
MLAFSSTTQQSAWARSTTLPLPVAATPDTTALSIRRFMAFLSYKVIHSATASQARRMGFLEQSVVDNTP